MPQLFYFLIANCQPFQFLRQPIAVLSALTYARSVPVSLKGDPSSPVYNSIYCEKTSLLIILFRYENKLYETFRFFRIISAEVTTNGDHDGTLRA